jgi:anti-sigma factor RsiW
MSTRDAPSGTVPGGRTPQGAPPTDLELMLWVDGELDADRAGEIADYIRIDPRARAVVSALRQGSATVAEDALRHAELSDADTIADNVMEAIDAAASRHLIAPVRRAPAWRAPAIAAISIALAAAAAWTIIVPSELAKPIAKRAPAVSSGATAVASNEEEAKEGVWIDVVDFGTRPGTIFYVPSEDESILAVVWLTEDDTPSSGDMP